MSELMAILNRIAEQLPSNCYFTICIDRDDRWIELWKDCTFISLEEFTSVDSTLEEQINDGIIYCKGYKDDGT